MAGSALPSVSNTKLTGRFAFLRQLLADGISCIFGNPGSSEENLLDALRDEEFRSLKYYLAYHEGTAVAMAWPFVKSDHDGPCAWRVVDRGSGGLASS